MRRRTVFAGVAVAAATAGIVLAIQGVSGADGEHGTPEPAPTSTIQEKTLGDPGGAVLPTGGATPLQMPVK